MDNLQPFCLFFKTNDEGKCFGKGDQPNLLVKPQQMRRKASRELLCFRKSTSFLSSLLCSGAQRCECGCVQTPTVKWTGLLSQRLLHTPRPSDKRQKQLQQCRREVLLWRKGCSGVVFIKDSLVAMDGKFLPVQGYVQQGTPQQNVLQWTCSDCFSRFHPISDNFVPTEHLPCHVKVAAFT